MLPFPCALPSVKMGEPRREREKPSSSQQDLRGGEGTLVSPWGHDHHFSESIIGSVGCCWCPVQWPCPDPEQWALCTLIWVELTPCLLWLLLLACALVYCLCGSPLIINPFFLRTCQQWNFGNCHHIVQKKLQITWNNFVFTWNYKLRTWKTTLKHYMKQLSCFYYTIYRGKA